jgi:hypothetical protein
MDCDQQLISSTVDECPLTSSNLTLERMYVLEFRCGSHLVSSHQCHSLVSLSSLLPSA